MKYEAKRNYLYPVSRPWADDYAAPDMNIAVTADPVGYDVRINIRFGAVEESIKLQVEAGSALCVAMLYCRETLHRQTLNADAGKFSLTELIDGNLLFGDVELNPAIIAMESVNHSTKTAHREYGGSPIRIGKFQPLAIAQTWRFQVNTAERPAKSVFNLKIDEDDALLDDMFGIRVDHNEPYIDIVANANTMKRFNDMRADDRFTTPSVYMNALMEALSSIKHNGDSDDAPTNGWLNCVKRHLVKHNLNIGDHNAPGEHSLLYAAQVLLSKPFGELMTAVNGADDPSN